MSGNETRLRQVMADVFHIAADTIGDDTSVDTVEKWDSLTHLNLILALEQEFDVALSEEEAVESLNFPLVKMALATHGVTFD
jgi:acyl carrier protein